MLDPEPSLTPAPCPEGNVVGSGGEILSSLRCWLAEIYRGP